METRCVLAATPIISEFLASNSGGLRDSDGESSDWIELYNPTQAAVNLAGWSLTDNAGDLNEWIFPAVDLLPNDYLVVFASGKNRAVAGSELHTNFRLSSDGEFLALVNPIGTIVSQYAPVFPTQATNVSYGSRFDTQTFVTTGTAARTFIPANDSLGDSWKSPSFSDAAWSSTPVGIGFGVKEPGFDVTYVKANTEVDDVDEAIQILGNPAQQTQVVTGRSGTINYMGNGGGGRYNGDIAFPTQSIGDDINDFILQATTTVSIPESGSWSFGVNSDDGFRLILSRAGVDYVVEFPWQRAPADTIGTLQLPAAGEYQLKLVMYERAGGASVELFAAKGAYSDWDASVFDLIGDTSNGGLLSAVAVPAGPTSPLRSDIGAAMRNVNASAYLRVPFELSSPSSVDALRLRMRYDDGFIAYLNGVEIARRNAPAPIGYNSSATQERTLQQSLITEDINVGNYLSALQSGTNVLAIQGLNVSAGNSSFLILPELIGSRLFESDPAYFEIPTPGGPNGAPSLGLVDRVLASAPAGFYDGTIQVALSTTTNGATIRYTIDGSAPTSTHGILYSAPINVSGTTTLRAVAYRSGYVTLPTITRSYLFVSDIVNQSLFGQAPPGWPTTWGNNVVDYGMDPDVISIEGVGKVKSALKAIPSLSIATDLSNLFDPSTGIYANSYNDGRDWERPASLELLNPDGTPGFQVNAGLRIRGGYSRSTDNPKHAFRLFFRGEYGDSTLEYPMFGASSPMTSFKKLDLRTAQNYSWSFGGDPSNNFVAEYFNRLTQLAMGQPSTRSEWYHLYIDGQYWGLYQTQERAEAEFAASYFGGLVSNYDVIKPEAGPYAIYATDGNLDAWYRLWDLVRQNAPGTSTPAVASNDEYLKLQGRNADGSENLSYENLLDVDNLIVYMINILYGGNLDAPISAFLGNQRVNNFFAVRDRTSRSGFKFFLHDSEHTFRDVNENRNGPWPAGDVFEYSNPQWIHQRLMANAEYRMRFADLTQRYFFYEGALSVGESQKRFNAEAAKIDQAIIAESARWGDAKRPDFPLTRADWLNAVTGVVGGYFPVRNPVMIQQFRNTTLDGITPAKLFPTIDAPTFIVNGNDQHGGAIPPNSTLRFGANSGLVYYTTDGTDPRLFGGGINPNASIFDPQSTVETIVTSASTWRFRDTGIDLGSAWRNRDYNDTTWESGNAELGYGDGDEATVVSFGNDVSNKFITTYFRKSISIADTSTITGLRLRLKRDDGAVVYINGVEAARSNMPVGTITASTLAASAVVGTDESTFFQFELNPGMLVSGTNVIAIEIHQVTANSSDVSFDAEIKVTRQSSLPIALGFLPLQFKARVLSDSAEWSALEQATFSVPLARASSSNLRVTELQYNPLPYTGDGSTNAPLNDKDSFEFLELRNISSNVIRLDGVSLTGVTYTFPTSTSGTVTWLLPGESIVIVKNQQAFAARYLGPNSPYANIKIAPGDYGATNLSNGGEGITVFAYDGTIIQQFTYDDNGPGWPSNSDGGGPSLTILRTNPALYNNGQNWRTSFVTHGTPGIEENDPPIAISISAVTVSENSPSALIGVLSTDDYDDLDTFTYSIPPSSDDGAFVIFGNELRVGTTGLDFEQSAARNVVVRSTDAAGAFIERTLTITITDVNEAPVLTRGQSDITGNVLSVFSNSGTWRDPELNAVSMSASLGTVTKNNDGTWNWNYVPSQRLSNQIVTISASDGSLSSSVSFTINALAAVVSRNVYYGGSTFAGSGVDAALDTSKVIAKSGTTSQKLTFANLINTSRGINGLVLDVAGMSTNGVTAADFVFRMSPKGQFNATTNPPSSWGSAPNPLSISVTAGTTNTPARARIEWPNNAIENRWLQIKILANANTGLLVPEVYYIGHLLGETNGLIEAGGFFVRSTDVNLITGQINPSVSVPVTSPLDLNKDGRVRTTDSSLAINALGARLTQIEIPPAGSGDEGEGGVTGGSLFSAPRVETSKLDFLERAFEIKPRFTGWSYDVLPLATGNVPSVTDSVIKDVVAEISGCAAEKTRKAAFESLDSYFAQLDLLSKRSQ